MHTCVCMYVCLCQLSSSFILVSDPQEAQFSHQRRLHSKTCFVYSYFTLNESVCAEFDIRRLLSHSSTATGATFLCAYFNYKQDFMTSLVWNQSQVGNLNKCDAETWNLQCTSTGPFSEVVAGHKNNFWNEKVFANPIILYLPLGQK